MPLEDTQSFAKYVGGCATNIAIGTARLREDPGLNHLRRVTTRKPGWPEVRALAFDHRSQIEDTADAHGDP